MIPDAVVDPDPLVMNPLVDIHIHPPPAAYPIDVAQIATITVKCPVRGRGLVVRDLTRASAPALFALFADLVARGGELELSSDAPLIADLVALGFLVREADIIDWPAFAIPLAVDEAPPPTSAPASTWRVDPSFLYQAARALHPGVRWPADYDEQAGRLRCFADGPTLWIGDALPHPRWLAALAADELAAVAALAPNAIVPAAALSPRVHRALVALGALHATDAPAALDPLARFAAYHAAYARDGYAIARDLLPTDEHAALRRYYRALLVRGLLPLGDRQNAARYSAYNDPVGRFVHARLASAMSAVVGQRVIPSFSYFFSYLPGAALEPHRDRPQAEFSITLQIDHVLPDGSAPPGATGWPLCFALDDGRAAQADLRLGDAVLYHGRALTHHRPVLPADQTSSVLVLEYVPHDFTGLVM